ncbi:MAG: DEAD/DEAH box helicase [Cyanobacteriota bacterium]|nr:DEAD/DEAH box helicase [Cyanobacteriota bacterium]
MAILHGFWVVEAEESYLFIWGETWRRLTEKDEVEGGEIAINPYGLTEAELSDWEEVKKRRSLSNKKTTKGRTKEPNIEIIALPTELYDEKLYPIYSGTKLLENNSPLYLYPWEIEGIRLNITEAIAFLQSLPLSNIGTNNSFIGEDLRFWSHIARWSLDLLARSKFLPSLEPDSNNAFIPRWQPLIDSATDRGRLHKFARQMPISCRAYLRDLELPQSWEDWQIKTENIPPVIPLKSSEELLHNFLDNVIDSQVRELTAEISPGGTTSLHPVVRQWLKALARRSTQKLTGAKETQQLATLLNNWKSPLLQSQTGDSLYRACFRLHPPLTGSKSWGLQYYLQATDDPEFLVEAQTIWERPVERLVVRGREINFPQETFLSGLGLASKLFPAMEPSLQTATPHSCTLTALEAYEFIKVGSWRFGDTGLGVILPPSLANREGGVSRLGLSVRAQTAKLKGNQKLGLHSVLDFQWELSLGGQKITKAAFDRLVQQQSPLVKINGEWVELQPIDIQAARAFLQEDKDNMSLSVEDALRLASGETEAIGKLPIVNFEASGQLQELLDTLTDNSSLEAIATPDSFEGELRPYQLRGVSWLAFMERWGLGACLADDMGLGKTIELIAFLLHQQEEDALEGPTLLVCPTSVLGNWEREVKKFGPSLEVVVHHGDKRPKGKDFVKAIKGKDLVITSYPLLQRDEKTLVATPWRFVVLDEAQNIKNPEAKQSKAARKLEGSFKIALTGTPLENRLSELRSILDFLNPGYLGSRQFFQRRFATPIEKYGDTNSLQTLRSLVQPFILRRLKTDKDIIQDLPEKQENTVFCALAKEQAAIYQKLVDEYLADIESSEGIQRRGKILALLTKLKQLCNHPALLEGKESKSKSKSKKKKKGAIASKASVKLRRLEEMLEEVLLEGDRALIFTQFAEWGKMLQPYLEEKLGREILFLYGSTRKNKREEMIDRFQNDPQGPPIMILSIKAGGTGLNLTRANHVFHFDRWWNPAVENQATDRVFRIGQTRNVQVHKFVCKGTLEEKIHDLIESKKELAEQVVGAGEQWLTELNTDELRNLLILDRQSVIDEDE